MSDNRYPADEELERIANWPVNDWLPLMAFARSIWWMPDWGWRETADPKKLGVTHYCLATGGWSGNESIIEALQANFMFWGCCWLESLRGGGYHFSASKAGGMA